MSGRWKVSALWEPSAVWARRWAGWDRTTKLKVSSLGAGCLNAETALRVYPDALRLHPSIPGLRESRRGAFWVYTRYQQTLPVRWILFQPTRQSAPQGS